ncbi:MAG: phospholipid scramblase-related protein [Ignavibacteriales bacterium]|nr:phospholipid scramblase-related protein [Ignavibacteriales bacterium]
MLLNNRTFFVKEQVAVLKLTETYDIFDPATREQIGVARDEPTSLQKYARLVVQKRMLPTTIRVYEQNSTIPVITLQKKAGLFRITVIVLDARQNEIGSFTSKIFSLGGGFFVNNRIGNRIAEVKGDWKGWNFRFLDHSGNELGIVTKKWAGIGKELFTTADNYLISLSGSAVSTPEIAALLLAAGLSIDIVYKERK